MPPNIRLPPTHRRPLSFPAVHPCQSISPATILTSLITLSQNISTFQPNSFPTQKRNSRETKRQIQILLIFFQELQSHGSPIPKPIIPIFSNLHFTLQKIHFLFQDCSLQNARLWLLIKSQFIATQFHLLIHSISESLHALPLHVINICDEVKEVIQLLTKQNRTINLVLDHNEERQTKRVISILNQFEKGTEPEVDSIKQVLDYLEIKTWLDCNEEIKFLQYEIESEQEQEKEVSLLSGLKCFLCYCRVVLFETIDFQLITRNRSETRCRRSIEMSTCVPDDYRCPISLELMTDPVTVSTGQTYNRASIQQWFKAGNITCPKTGEKLVSTEVFPNTALKTIIQQFCYNNRISISPTKSHVGITVTTVNPGSPAAAHAIQFASWSLAQRLVFGTDEQKNKASYEIGLLAKSNIFNTACLIEMGTVPPLIDLVLTSTTQENAIFALLKLSKHGNGREFIMESRGLDSIVTVLIKGYSLEARRFAADIIFYLTSVKEYRKLIGENSKVVSGLVELIKKGTIRVKKSAVDAIFGLLLLPRNHPKVLASGAVPAIVNVLCSWEKSYVVNDCLAVLVALAENVDGSRAVLDASGLSLVVGILQSATSRAEKEYCVSILVSLCANIGDEIVSVLVKDGSVIMPLLYAILTNGTPLAEKKARKLINVLQEFDEKKTLGTSVLHQRLLQLN
ncbi:U-box domain-containing protein 18 [Lathyrus oleraceus]|uniref:U-box domain-containing protein 18 n=1 Tax=Pisum sativum TaxID=3888 RepID=UPI0021D3C3BE|nr:U-box domain-containing protein 18-like [Pisum sativum]